MKKQILLISCVVLFTNHVNCMNINVKRAAIFTPAIISTIYGCKKLYDTYQKDKKTNNFSNENLKLNFEDDIKREYKKGFNRICYGWLVTLLLVYKFKSINKFLDFAYKYL